MDLEKDDDVDEDDDIFMDGEGAGVDHLDDIDFSEDNDFEAILNEKRDLI